MKNLYYMGMFDPIHGTHIQIMEELSKLDFDNIFVCVYLNGDEINRDQMFSYKERRSMVSSEISIAFAFKSSKVRMSEVYDDFIDTRTDRNSASVADFILECASNLAFDDNYILLNSDIDFTDYKDWDSIVECDFIKLFVIYRVDKETKVLSRVPEEYHNKFIFSKINVKTSNSTTIRVLLKKLNDIRAYSDINYYHSDVEYMKQLCSTVFFEKYMIAKLNKDVEWYIRHKEWVRDRETE